MKIEKETKDFHNNPMKSFAVPSITFSIDNPEAIFVQEVPFYTSNIMRVLYKKNLSLNGNYFFLELIKSLITYFNWSLKFSGPVVHNSKVFLPMKNKKINYEEIDRIGNVIRVFDETITLHQRKTEQLELLKKYLLKNMFV